MQYQPLTDKKVKQLFMRFGAIWLQKWTSAFPTSAALTIAKAEWSEGLSGISDKSILRGITTVRQTLEWPPSIAEFRRLCLGLPDKQTVRFRVLQGGGDPLTNMIREMIGDWELRSKPIDWISNQAEKFYPIALQEMSDVVIKEQSPAIMSENEHLARDNFEAKK